MRKSIIISHNLGRLANQLWQYISVYAYSLEKRYQCENLAFFEYQKYFDNLPKTKALLLFEKINNCFLLLSKKYGRYCTYTLLSLFLKITTPFRSKDNEYFSDWLYRNPKAIEKYRKIIIRSFQPNAGVWIKINYELDELRKKYKSIIGVHIRKGDYASLNWKRLYFEDKEVNNILQSYLSQDKLHKDDVCFLICSDCVVDITQFPNLSIIISKGNAVEDLFKLSLTDTIIGSDSTFGAFASYYGDILYIVFNKKIDWDYYKNNRGYFENKYNTTTHYQYNNLLL